MRQAGNRFLDPVLPSDPTFTATLDIPIFAKDGPCAEGTGGFYLSAGGEDENIYLVTARHVVLPLDKDDNKEYERKDDGKARADVVILGTSGFNEKLAVIDYVIRGQESVIIDANERIDSVKGLGDPGSVREREQAVWKLQDAELGLKALKAFRHEIATHWEVKENRVFGELVWAPPIVLSTDPGQYTLDIAIIKFDAGMLAADNYRGNAINIGDKYTRQQFMEQVCLHPTSPTSFKFPANRCVALQDQVPASDIVKPPMLDANRESCLLVFKNGANTGTTTGKANNVSSYTRNSFGGQYQESRRWPIISTDKHSGAFSAKRDSGSCVADVFSRVGGIITGGSGATDSCDVTYATPISFITEVFHDTKRFKNAHLNPVLA